MKNDEYYMNIALNEAKKAYLKDEVPIGAVIVDANGDILSKGYNLRESKNDVTMHAEIIALRKANKKRGSWRLEDCTIYVTVEPCSMCAGAILWSRIKRVVYGAPDLKGGALGSSYNLYEVKGINHRPEVTCGILCEQSSKILKDYFKMKRSLKK